MKNKQGVTLIELILVIGIMGLVFSIIFTMWNFGARTFANGERNSNVQFDTRLTTRNITKEIQNAETVKILSCMPLTLNADLKYMFLDTTDNMIKVSKGGTTKALSSIITGGASLLFSREANSNILGLSLTGDPMKTNFLINTKVFIQNMKSGKSVDGGFSGAVLEFGPFTPIERAIIDASNLTLDSMGINNPITGNIILPKEGPNGTVISWEFTPADYIDDTGKVTLPLISSYLEGGKVSVIMKATVTKGTEMETAQIKTFQVDVLQREPIELITEILPDAKVGETFNYTFEAIGGYDVYEYSFGDAPLEGFSIDPTTGILSGTPLTAGVYPFNIKVTDKDNNETGLLPEEKESKGTFTLTVYE